MLTEAERIWLKRMADNGGTWPDRPFLASPEAIPLMRRGLAEVIKPRGQCMPYAEITPAGLAVLKEGSGE